MARKSFAKAHLKHRTRDDLRAFLLLELPGWDAWLTTKAAQIQWRAQHEALLRPEESIVSEIATYLDEVIKLFGERVEDVFLPYAQLRPAFDPGREKGRETLPASSAFKPAPNAATTEDPVTWEQLAIMFNQIGRLPSPRLGALLGAWAVVRRRSRPGRPPNLRLEWALDYVAKDLGPYCRSTIAEVRRPPPVVPPGDCSSAYADRALRQTAPPLALCALTAVYLALPNRKDPEYDHADDSKHMLAPSAVEEATKALRVRLTRLTPQDFERDDMDLSFLEDLK